MMDKKLTRSSTDKFLAGVCGGIAAYTGLDATIVRVITVIVMLATNAAGPLIYLAMWLLLPTDVGGPTGLDQLKHQFGSSSN